MYSEAGIPGDMDYVTAAMLGTEILEDTSSIGAILEIAKSILVAAVTYLDILDKQGIAIPGDLTIARSDYPTKFANLIFIQTKDNLNTLFHATVVLCRRLAAAWELCRMSSVPVKDRFFKILLSTSRSSTCSWPR